MIPYDDTEFGQQVIAGNKATSDFYANYGREYPVEGDDE